MNTEEIVAVLIIVLGFWLFYRSRRRVFERRNAFGQEMFPSYGCKLLARLIDWALIAVAVILAGTGILYLAIDYRESWGWIVLLPVAWLFIIGFFPSKRPR